MKAAQFVYPLTCSWMSALFAVRGCYRAAVNPRVQTFAWTCAFTSLGCRLSWPRPASLMKTPWVRGGSIVTCRSAPVSVPAVSRLISSPLSRSVSVILAILTGVQLPRWLNSKEPACQCRRFSPWVGKLSRRRTWQPTPAFLPGQSYGQRSLAGYGPRSQRIRHS